MMDTVHEKLFNPGNFNLFAVNSPPVLLVSSLTFHHVWLLIIHMHALLRDTPKKKHFSRIVPYINFHNVKHSILAKICAKMISD